MIILHNALPLRRFLLPSGSVQTHQGYDKIRQTEFNEGELQMKKFWIALMLTALLALGAGAACGETTTLLLYLCGTDLQDAGCMDLFEIAEVEAGDAMNLVALCGGAEEWDLEDLQGGSRTFAVIRDGYFEELEDWGEKSMGDPESLEEFLSYGLAEYPADRTVVVLWDHGAGTEGGICFDETADDDGLTLTEINDVLGQLEESVPGYHINIFGCDACMMATYEMAAMLSHHPVDYYVASEELEPGNGWYYTGWLQALAEDPSISDEDLCGVIIDTFMEAGLQDDPDDTLTLSAVRLSEIRALENSLEDFASVMTGEIQSGNLSAIRRGRSRMYTFGSFNDGSWDMVDLGTALDTYAQFDAGKAAEAKKCLEKAVVASAQTDNLDICSGLSVLIPQDTVDGFEEYREGFELPEAIPNWLEFVDAYVTTLQGGSYHFTATAAEQTSGESIQGTTFTGSPATGWLEWDDEAEDYVETDREGTEIAISDSTQGFTAMLSQEDLANLDYVEGMLMMAISDEDGETYVEFGSMQNNLVDWETGQVVSLFDGTWPTFGGQLVVLYDQIQNGNTRRSLIPVKLNGEATYLVVSFPADGSEGRIIGANAGYDENGLPIRNTTKLKNGDVIIPVYTMYYEEEGLEDLQEAEFDGDEIIWQDGMTVTFEDLGDEEEPTEMLFCFIFNDIFGDYTMSEFISFEI